jgi:hypothetical protein
VLQRFDDPELQGRSIEHEADLSYLLPSRKPGEALVVGFRHDFLRKPSDQLS